MVDGAVVVGAFVVEGGLVVAFVVVWPVVCGVVA